MEVPQPGELPGGAPTDADIGPEEARAIYLASFRSVTEPATPAVKLLPEVVNTLGRTAHIENLVSTT